MDNSADPGAASVPHTSSQPSILDSIEKSSNPTSFQQDPESATMASKAEDGEIPRKVHGYRWVLLCASLYIACLIYGLGMTISADIQGAVVKSFDRVDQITWLGTGFPLASVCGILPVSAFYKVFNLKWMFISSIVVFEVGSALCGAAPNMDVLIVGRIIAGLGGTGMYIGMLKFFSFSTSNQERSRYMSGIGVAWGAGAILGPVVGGAFSTSSATWRWSFYMNLVIAAVCAPIYFGCFPTMKPEAITTTSTTKKLASMDWIGFLLSMAVLVCLVLVLTFAGAAWAWDDHRTIIMFVVFGVLVVLTVIQQRFLILTTYETRMTPPSRILKDRTQILVNIQTAMTVTNLVVPLYYIPLYFQFCRGDTAIMAAVRLLPFILVLISANMAAGYLIQKINYYYAMYLASGILMTMGGSLMYTIDIKSPSGYIYGYSILLAIGSGSMFQAGYSIAPVKASLKGWTAQDIQGAVSLQNISQTGFTLLSLLISGQMFQSYSFQNMEKVMAGSGISYSDRDIRSIVAGAQSALFRQLPDNVKVEATEAITNAMRKVYILSIIAGAVSVAAALVMKKERLSG